MKTNRRSFLVSAAASLGAPYIRSPYRRAAKFRTALVGTGWWGMNILREAIASGETTVVGMCDVDESQLNGARDVASKLSSDTPKLYRDYREMISREKPEIVIVATPDHWHALTAIEALRSGAHLYLEKPISHTIREARAIVN